MAPSCERFRVSYSMSDSMSCIRRAKENGTANPPDKPNSSRPCVPCLTARRTCFATTSSARKTCRTSAPDGVPAQDELRAAAVHSHSTSDACFNPRPPVGGDQFIGRRCAATQVQRDPIPSPISASTSSIARSHTPRIPLRACFRLSLQVPSRCV